MPALRVFSGGGARRIVKLLYTASARGCPMSSIWIWTNFLATQVRLPAEMEHTLRQQCATRLTTAPAPIPQPAVRRRAAVPHQNHYQVGHVVHQLEDVVLRAD